VPDAVAVVVVVVVVVCVPVFETVMVVAAFEK